MSLSTTLLLLSASPACALRSVLVVGGNGRVGASTVRWLHKLAAAEDLPLELCIGGRRRDSFDAAAARLARQGVADVSFVPLDLEEPATLGAAVAGRSLVVHTAGPFQQREDPALLQACIEAGVPYCDVCDELLLSRNAKALGAQAVAAGVPAVLSCGIWPGVSALMAAEAVERLGGNGSCERLEFSFFTAGTGGAGPTIVSATFLLLCTPVATYQGGRLVELEPWTERRLADFGEGIGERECYLLDNPDVPTCAEALGVAEASSRFGTAPAFWNSLFGGMKLLPQSLLSDKEAMQGLSVFSMPIIRAVDALVGGTNAMRVDAWPKGGGPQLTLRVAHADLEQCVGQATAAFGLELLRGGRVPPGCWFPAELSAEARASILGLVREDAFVWEV
eukprot:Transcript_2966.p2 GENE.Transcript_2966~~Transcript_2966.p2  ORF type:complete len:403 (+),score=152.63 Transcript_2966:33-1211(+)